MGQPPRRSDTPVPGHYLVRLVRGGPWVAAEIRLEGGQWSTMIDGAWEGPAADPWSLRSLETVHWHGRETTPEEALYRIGLKRYAELYAPEAPAANPRKAINVNKALPF